MKKALFAALLLVATGFSVLGNVETIPLVIEFYSDATFNDQVGTRSAGPCANLSFGVISRYRISYSCGYY